MGLHIRDFFPFEPTVSQSSVMEKLEQFLASETEHGVFLLKGYAGTGKSSLVGALAKMAVSSGHPVRLLAPTGRAAKVLQGYCGLPAYTIHRVIYRAKSASAFDTNGVSTYDVGYNREQEGTLYIVDEVSMISNTGEGFTPFGDGRLLDDLMEYCFSIDGSRLLLIGDDAQLPPVGTPYSPALSEEYLRGYTPNLRTGILSEIVRQERAGEIVLTSCELRARILRLAMGEDWFEPLLSPPEKGGEITFITGEDLPDLLERSYREKGQEETILLTRTNLEAESFNQGIRRQSLYLEEEAVRGEQVMVVRNNYLHYPTDENGKPMSSFVANGELLRILGTRKEERMYGFTFRDAELEDAQGGFVSAKIILESLYTGTAALTAEQREQLYKNVAADYPEETTKRGLYQKLRKDPYLNALQIKYAYAMTVHKAQGGGWKNVFLNIGYLTPEMIDLSFCRWLYTAITRATEHLYIISPPAFIFGDVDTHSAVRYLD